MAVASVEENVKLKDLWQAKYTVAMLKSMKTVTFETPSGNHAYTVVMVVYSTLCVCVCVIFASRLHPSPPFSVSPYIRMYVRALLGPVGACVRLCLRVLLPADVPSATRVRHSNFSSVNEIW